MPSETSFTPIDAVISTTIANGAQVSSSAIDMGGMRALGLILPAALTSTSIGFTVSDAIDGTYVALTKDDGTAYSVTVAASKAVALSPVYMAAWRFLKVTTGSAEGAERTIKVIGRPV